MELEELEEKDLNPEFVEQVAEFCAYILSDSNAKTLSDGIIVNGPRELFSLLDASWTFLLPVVRIQEGGTLDKHIV